MNRMFIFALLVLSMALLSAADDGYQTFTDTQGRELEARLVKYEPASGRVTFQLRSGRRSTALVSILSEADRVRIKDWYVAEEMLAPGNLAVKMTRTWIGSGSYHEKRNGWQSHHPGMKVEQLAYEIALKNRNGSTFEDITVDYCVFFQSKRKVRTGRSELEAFSDGITGWVTVEESKEKKTVVPFSMRNQFAVKTLLKNQSCDTVTESIELREGAESRYSSGTGNRRSYTTRRVEDELVGIIIRISVPLPSGGFARKEYSHPADLLTEEIVDWNTVADAGDDRLITDELDEEILKRAADYIREKKFKEAEKLCRHLHDGDGTLKYHGAWKLGNIYLSFENSERNISLGVDWLLKASKGGFSGPYLDLSEFYACDPDPAVRDGEKALKYASWVMNMAQKDPAPGTYEIMACACARDGQFETAVEMMNRAVAALEKRRGGKLSSSHEYLLKLEQFTNGRAWPD